MKKLCKLIAAACALMMLAGCGAEGEPEMTETEPKNYDITMQYDDVLTLEDLQAQGEVTITNGPATSCQVGTETPDEAVLTWENEKLYATGIGTSTVQIGEEEYRFTVVPAPISLMMITGHSLGAGEKGDAAQSIKLREGSAYSSYEGNAARCLSGVDGRITYGLGCLCANRAPSVSQMTTGEGVRGMSSGFADTWTEKTGEKVWVLNAAKGGSKLSDWTPEGELYPHAVALFQAAAKILDGEVQAGHYTISHMGLINHTSANGDQKWEHEEYRTALLTYWENMKKDLTCTIAGKSYTVEAMGLVPCFPAGSNKWETVNSAPLTFNNGRVENFAIGADSTYPELFIAGTLSRGFTDSEFIEEYFEDDAHTAYETHGTPVRKIYDIRQAFDDGVHFTQVVYNALGQFVADDFYDYFFVRPQATEVKLLDKDGVTEIGDTMNFMHYGDAYAVPDCTPAAVSDLTFETTGGIVYDHGMLSAPEATQGQLIIKQNGTVVRTVEITVK